MVLVIFLLLVGVAVIPSGPAHSLAQSEMVTSFSEAATTDTGTLKIPVSEDVSVVNGTNPDTNYGADSILYLGTAFTTEWFCARSWFKFDFTHLSRELSVQKATLKVNIEGDFASTDGADEPIGIYYCDDDSWEQMTITWNNQPTFSATPTFVINSPASPDMFIPGNWYSWEVTSDVRMSLTGDKILTEILKFTVEVGTQNSFLMLRKSSHAPLNSTYLEIEYTTPTTDDLTVEGISSGILLDYIRNPCPNLGWTFSDPDLNDFQKDYDVEVWNNTYYNDTMLWQAAHERVWTIHQSGVVTGETHPFGLDEEFRLQMKFPGSILPSSGIVDKLYFTAIQDSALLQIEDLEVSLLAVPSSAYLTGDLNSNYGGRTPTVVLSRDHYEAAVIDHTLEIDVEDIFFLNEDLNLIIEIRLRNNTGDLITLARTTTGGPGSVATCWGSGSYFGNTADYTATRTYDLKIGFLTSQVFVGDPLADNAFPFGTTPGYSGRFQIKYNQTWIHQAGYIDRVFMRVDQIDTDVVFEDFTVTVVESPVQGPIENGTWVENYGGATPTIVIDADLYTVRNLGNCLVLDFDNTFYYTNTRDLLIDIQWGSLVSGECRVLYDDPMTSSYGAWDVHYMEDFNRGASTAGYNLFIDFVNSEDGVPLEDCITLVNATHYYWRVRTCDSAGIWSDWATHAFKYEVLSSVPAYSAAVTTPDPAIVNEQLTLSLNITYPLGLYWVGLDVDGGNQTMTADGDTFSYTWTPTSVGLLNYTIFMLSNGNTWSIAQGSILVQEGVGDMTLILILGGAAVVVVIVVIVYLKRRPAK